MLPGRQLINEIENLLFDLDFDECELSSKLEQYILDHGEDFLDEWHDIQKNFKDKDKQEHLFLMFDTIQSEVYSELEEAEEKVEKLTSNELIVSFTKMMNNILYTFNSDHIS